MNETIRAPEKEDEKTAAAPEAAPEREETESGREVSAQDETAGAGAKEAHKGKKEEKNVKKEYQKLQKEYEAQKRELAKLQKELEQRKEAEETQNDRYLRMMAEYDNFRKRSSAEKDAVYASALTDVFKEILPVIDALELALKYDAGGESIKKGVEMTLNKFKDALGKLGVEEVEATTFDPNYHNAVMHVEDDSRGEGEILEVFQKGYKKGDKIIRYAMVKVAN